MNKKTTYNKANFILIGIGIIFLVAILFLTGCKQFQLYFPSPKNFSPENQTILSETTNETQTQNTTEEGKGYMPYDSFSIYFQKIEGNSIIARLNNKSILINGGKDSDSNSILKNLRNIGIEKLDYIIVTNSNIENTGGLPYIILRTSPTKIYDNGIPTPNTEFYKEIYPSTTTIEKDTTLIFEDSFVRFIVPYDDGLGISDNQDDNSIIIKLIYYDLKVLIMSGCGSICEERISDSELNADILVVSNNCDSTSLVFLGKANPDKVLIKKDCPEIKKRLDYLNIDIYENDDYVLTSNGSGYEFKKI